MHNCRRDSPSWRAWEPFSGELIRLLQDNTLTSSFENSEKCSPNKNETDVKIQMDESFEVCQAGMNAQVSQSIGICEAWAEVLVTWSTGA